MTTVEMPQHLEALAHANKVRMAGAAFRRSIANLSQRDGAAMLADYLENPDSSEIGRLPVLLALRSIHRVGDQRAERILQDAAITRARSRNRYRNNYLRLEDLTLRERAALIDILRSVAA